MNGHELAGRTATPAAAAEAQPTAPGAAVTRSLSRPQGGRQRCRWLLLILLIGVTGAIRPVGAAPSSTLPAIKLTYRGGPLIRNVKVATLFWGSSWSNSSLTGYFNSFFRTLFADGRFMASLAQYSTTSYTIGNGSFVATDTDTRDPSSKITDAQIRSEIQAQVAAGNLPQPDDNTLYCVFTPPGSVVYDSYGNNSTTDFSAYHDYDFDSGFAYAVIPYDDTLQDPRLMTVYASHELADAVTDPEPYDTTVAWYDDYYGEVADIPATLYTDNQLSIYGLVAELDASDGTPYLVQTHWSLKDNAPVAFSAV